MRFQSLIAHNGVVHQKSNSVEQPKPSTTETKTVTEPNADSQNVAPEDNSSSKKQIVETPENKTENSTTTEIQTTQSLTSATLFPGFGESIFTLLIVSPFFLFSFKKWLHR
ncbi:hypothetical protein [Pleurocapsa sp. PCC 7319]|uniref:hypothetical protein n=1 Tax=Pleurocapsa sp. PCC 7319 TaxID=118161 RepID=UPI00034B41B2|nr:hypothetical protein [Pleurocapsa sp. PCC 7319]